MGTEKQHKMTMDHLRSTKRPVRETLWLPVDEEMADDLERLDNELEMARQRYRLMPDNDAALAEVRRLEGEYMEVRTELRKPANALKFVFQSMGPARYEKLQDEHPVSEKQKEEMREKGLDPDLVPFDIDSFSVALIARSCIEPEMTVEFVQEIKDCDDGTWSTGDFKELYESAITANVKRRSANLGKEFKPMAGSKKS